MAAAAHCMQNQKFPDQERYTPDRANVLALRDLRLHNRQLAKQRETNHQRVLASSIIMLEVASSR